MHVLLRVCVCVTPTAGFYLAGAVTVEASVLAREAEQDSAVSVIVCVYVHVHTCLMANVCALVS